MYHTYLATEVNQTAITAQAAVLRKIADQGACVIVGRAANVVLKDYHPFRVFIHAPLDYRVTRVQRTYEDTVAKAKANIKRADDRRAKFYRTVTGQDWADATNYDLVLDGSIGKQPALTRLWRRYQRRTRPTKKQNKFAEPFVFRVKLKVWHLILNNG